ncbi:GPN2 domain containing protein [Candidatus Pelagibacterales bacterium]
MERYFHAEILEQKRQKELQERNLNAKRRLQEIASGNQTQWSGNLVYDLKGVNEAAKAILDPKLTHDEYEELLTHHDIIPNEVLKSTHYKLISVIDDHYKRLFNKYIELLLLKKEEGMLRSKRKIETPVVTFHEEIKSLTEEMIRLLKPRQQ